MSGANKGWWTPARDAILAAQYPVIGTAVSKILGNTPKACEGRANRLGIQRVFKTGRPKAASNKTGKRCKKSCYGHIPGGPVPSVFHLASAGGA